MDFHRYLVGSQIVVLGNGSEEDVLGVGTYKRRLRGGNTLLLHDALYAPGVQVCLLSLVFLMKFGFHLVLVRKDWTLCMVAMCLATLR